MERVLLAQSTMLDHADNRTSSMSKERIQLQYLHPVPVGIYEQEKKAVLRSMVVRKEIDGKKRGSRAAESNQSSLPRCVECRNADTKKKSRCQYM